MKSENLSTLSRRIEALDSFRGIASVLIMLTHLILFVPEVFQVENLSLIFDWLSWKLPYFFVLSGFVLTLSYMRNKGREHAYRNFIVNRIFRIFPLFTLATVMVFIIKISFGAGCDIEGASRFFNISWRIPATFWDLLHALTLVGFCDTWTFNNPAWTLVFEMRYAIVFPLFVSLLRKSWLFISIFIALSFVAYGIDAQFERIDIFYTVDSQLSNLCSMMNFLIFYLAGIVLALNRDRLSALYQSLPRWGECGVVLLSVLFMLAPKWVPHLVPDTARLFANNLVIMVGVVMWVVILINNRAISNIFSAKPLIALGRSSFSIYMWHVPIFTLNYMLFGEVLNVWVIVGLSAVVTLLVARLSYRFVEQPCIALSHRITGRF